MSDLGESNVEIRIQPGVVYKENRLIPVVTKPAKGNLVFLNSIKRHTIKTEDMVCCLSSPDGSEGIFLDSTGREYLVTLDELSERLSFVNSRFCKKSIPRYIFRRGSKEQYGYLTRKFLLEPSTRRKYKGWITEDGVLGDEVLNESYIDVLDGGCYISRDCSFRFKVLKRTKGGYRIKDLKDNRIYEVELSDLALMNPIRLNDEEVKR